MQKAARLIAVLVVFLLSASSQAQNDSRRGREWRERPKPLMELFDADGDGRFDDVERAKAREEARKRRRQSRRFGGGLRRQTEAHPTESVEIDPDAKPPKGIDLYDATTLRTLHLKFAADDWYEELGDFYMSGVDVPADLVVDGVVYPGVGVRYRGRSSFLTIGSSEKRSFNLDIDFTKDGQELYGYDTLNLLNCHADPTFIREVFFTYICGHYLPTLKMNYVRLVVNGEDWGVYVNAQQFNRDFLRETFGTGRGIRWKVPGRSPGAAFQWHGPELERYRRGYVLKQGEGENAWKTLVRVCEILSETEPEDLEDALRPIFDVDGALWHLALENVFMDNDSYVAKASDYAIYQDGVHGRIHLLQHDASEVFGVAGPEWDGEPTVSPVVHEHNPERPLIRRLLAVPALRARYLAHVRTLVDEWLDWETFSCSIGEYHDLIGDLVRKDIRKVFSTESFTRTVTHDHKGERPYILGVRRWVRMRRRFLLSHEEIKRPRPVIGRVSRRYERSPADASGPLPGERIRVTVKLSGPVLAEKAFLYHSGSFPAPFERLEMTKDEGSYSAWIPGRPAGSVVRYYVEARAPESIGTTRFEPSRTAKEPFTFRVALPRAKSSDLRINEVAAVRRGDDADDNRDWIELVNNGTSEIDLSGMFLSDDADAPRKWRFPAGAKITAGGYVVVWADSLEDAEEGLHASFRLSARGESVLLVDSDERGNRVLDEVSFPEVEESRTYGRFPDGHGAFRVTNETPAHANSIE